MRRFDNGYNRDYCYGYNNNNGWGNNNYGPNNGPRGGGGYDRRGGYPPPPPMDIPFDVGQKVIHKATGTELSVIRIGREQVECRKPDLNSVWCYVHELDPAPEPAQ